MSTVEYMKKDYAKENRSVTSLPLQKRGSDFCLAISWIACFRWKIGDEGGSVSTWIVTAAARGLSLFKA